MSTIPPPAFCPTTGPAAYSRQAGGIQHAGCRQSGLPRRGFDRWGFGQIRNTEKKLQCGTGAAGGEPAALCRIFHDHFFVSLLTNGSKWCIIFNGKRNGADELPRLPHTKQYQKGKGVFDSGMKKASLSFFAAAGRLELCLHGRMESGNGMPNLNRQTEYWRFSRAVSGL